MNAYQRITHRIIALLKQGTVPWRRPWRTAQPANLVSRRPYRGINLVLLACTAFASPWWLTYRQALELGGHVRKGEQATVVVFWKWLERTVEDPDTGETRSEEVPFLRYYHVFNLAQCDGISLERIPEEPTYDGSAIEAAERIVQEMARPPDIQHRGSQAFYEPRGDVIALPPKTQFGNAEAYYATLFHELTHSTGHPSRLGRFKTHNPAAFASDDYSKEELVAELGAAFLSGHAGIDNTQENNAAYIHAWLKRLEEDERLIITAASQAQKAADFILGTGLTSSERSRCSPRSGAVRSHPQVLPDDEQMRRGTARLTVPTPRRIPAEGIRGFSARGVCRRCSGWRRRP